MNEGNSCIIFVHSGEQKYFNYVLRQAKKTNKEKKIFVIGNGFITNINGINYVDKNDFNISFSDIYMHLSSNDIAFELMCFERWFLIRDFMLMNKIDFVYACDSDLMIYDNLSLFESKFRNYSFGYCRVKNQDNKRWSASAHFSFWNKEYICLFCKFLEEFYCTEKHQILLEKWQYHQNNELPGGVCDMTLLYLFSKDNNNVFFNLSESFDGNVCDDNINSCENYDRCEYKYDTIKNMKDIYFKNKKPYGFNEVLSKKVSFLTLHFQGGAKEMIEEFYYANNYLYNILLISKKMIVFFLKSARRVKRIFSLYRLRKVK